LELGISKYLGAMLINNKIALLCQQTKQYYFGSRDNIPGNMLHGSKCIALAYPDIRSHFNYQKDYKLTAPNILYSILHEINDYKILTISLKAIAGNNNKMSRIVIAGRVNIQKYAKNFARLGFCVHAMLDIWQIMLCAARELLPKVKSAWVIVVSEQLIYVFYFENNSIYMHSSFEHNSLNDIFAAVDEFKKDFINISSDAWCVGSLTLELEQGLTNKGLMLHDVPLKSDIIPKLSFELLCCMGAIAYMDLGKGSS
jgi:hypothetical protein